MADENEVRKPAEFVRGETVFKCLNCGDEFRPRCRFNRICLNCKNSGVWRRGDWFGGEFVLGDLKGGG